MKGRLNEMACVTNEPSSESTEMLILFLISKAEEMRLKRNIEQAKNLLNQATKMNDKLGDQLIKAVIFEGFGLCYLENEDYEKAIKFANAAIKIFSQLPGQRARAGTANNLVNLASTYSKLGKHEVAIQHQKQAIEILEILRNEGPDLELPVAYGNVEETYSLKMKKETVRICDEKSLSTAYGNMGEMLIEIEEYEKGLDMCEKGLNNCRNIGDKLGEANNLHNMGNAYNSLGKTKKCIQYCQESARIFLEIGNKNDASMSYGVLAMAYAKLGEAEHARRYFQRCIDIKRDMKQFADSAIAYGNRGLFNYKIGLEKFLKRLIRKEDLDAGKEDLECSIEDFKLAIQSTDKVLTTLSVDDNRTALSDRFYRWYDHLTPPFNLLGRSTAALLFLDLGRAKILRQLLIKQGKPRQDQFLVESSGNLELSWLAIENKKEEQRMCDLSREIQPLESVATVLFYNFNQHQILTIWVLHANGSVSLKTTDPSSNFSTAQHELEVSFTKMLKQARASLPRKYSFLDIQDQNAMASSDEKDANVSEMKRDQRSPANRADKPCYDLTKETRFRLYRSLIYPVKSFIKGTKLIIVPQRCLFFAPFSSFVDENDCVLSEKYQIQIIPSIHVLAMSIQSSSGKPVGNSLFVGDPDVTDVESELPRLPCAAEEAKYLASLLDSTPLIGAIASKKKVLELILEASVIHIAAHGNEKAGHIFLAPEASKSRAHQTKSSYLLTQSDILKCKLTARLVVLSCCNSGKGQVSSEGVLGIARSFLGAGASSVLVTLWRIDDKFTKLFMTVFYKKILEEKSVCLALKETMNEFQRNGEYKSFKFWAAFEILGEDVRFSKEDIEEIRRKNKLKL